VSTKTMIRVVMDLAPISPAELSCIGLDVDARSPDYLD